jgi:hypothetical protein
MGSFLFAKSWRFEGGRMVAAITHGSGLSFLLIFTPGQFSLKLLLANRLRGAATDDNL